MAHSTCLAKHHEAFPADSRCYDYKGREQREVITCLQLNRLTRYQLSLGLERRGSPNPVRFFLNPTAIQACLRMCRECSNPAYHVGYGNRREAEGTCPSKRFHRVYNTCLELRRNSCWASRLKQLALMKCWHWLLTVCRS